MWPEEIMIVRHGQSAGNVARDYADKNGLLVVEGNDRDMDVRLSTLGEGQSIAFGVWLAGVNGADDLAVFASPYVRTRETAELAFGASEKLHRYQKNIVDERLREREFGLITGLTRKGITQHFPLEVASYDKIKKFYYRPPGGESWCDVILRIRSFVDMLRRDYAGRKVLVFGHTVVVYAFRYVIENLSEKEILEIDSQQELANCSVTSYSKDQNADEMILTRFNFTEHLTELNQKVTGKSDVTKI